MQFSYLRHPRRLGFIAFNVLVLVAFAAWALREPDPGGIELADVPNATIATVGISVLLVVWLGAWAAWGILVLRRRLHRSAGN